MDAWNLQITGFLDPNEVSFPSQDDAIGKVIPAKNQRLDGKAVKSQEKGQESGTTSYPKESLR